MNQLIRIENGEVKLDSRMIADHFEKNHADVLRDIRDEIEKLETGGLGGESIFSLSSYTSQQNKELPCYEMGEEGALQLAARYDAVARRKLIIKIKELKGNATPQIDSVFLFQIAAQLEQKEKQIQVMQPKAEYFDALVERNLLTNIRDTAKELKVRQSDFVDWLLKKHCYRDQKGTIKPHAEYTPTLFELKEFQKNGCANNQTLITPRGRETFRLLLIKDGLVSEKSA